MEIVASINFKKNHYKNIGIKIVANNLSLATSDNPVLM